MIDETALLKQAVAELGVDKPIMSYRVVGDRIELHLLGGDIIHWPYLSGPAVPDQNAQLSSLSVVKLRRLARKHKIRGRSKMSRAQLIEALEAHDR
jgi:hypothetical protein